MKHALLFLPVLVAACGGYAPAIETATSALSFTPAAAPEPLASGGTEALGGPLGQACPGTRWIGYLRGPGPVPLACPPPVDPRWAVSKLFGPASHAAWAPDLDRFCKYEWTDTTSAPAAAPRASRPDMRLERDCRVVVPLSDPASAELADAHARAMNLPSFPAPATAPATQVRIAVVDGTPTETASGLPSGTGHGLAVAAVARRAGCVASSGCPFITSHQGLRLAGGDHGYQSDVARAIYEALQSFIADGTQQRLVINLSLGWDPAYGNGPGPGIRVPSYSVYAILQVAACEQALVVAAAGNRARIDAGTGPLLPAGWEPVSRLCPASLAYAPLVHAVGGLTSDDQPLALSRAASRPRLATPATRVTAALPDGTYTPVLSGSSMASASVAGVAALVWSFSPASTPEQLMATLFTQGVPLGVPVDFAQPPSVFNVRRVDACRAVQAVTAGAQRPLCGTRGPGVPAQPNAMLVFDALQPGLWLGPTQPARASAARVVEVWAAPDVTLVPWAGPQPTIPPCPLCTLIEQNGVLNLYGQIKIANNTRVERAQVRACIGECDGTDPTWKINAAFVNGTWLKVPLAGLNIASYNSARLEAEVRDDGTGLSTVHVSEVALNH